MYRFGSEIVPSRSPRRPSALGAAAAAALGILSVIGCTSTPVSSADAGGGADASVATDAPSVPDAGPDTGPGPVDLIAPGASEVVLVPSEGAGLLAVRVTAPDVRRFADGPPVIVEVNTFFTPRSGFYQSADVGDIGAVGITYLWPGTTDRATGASSEGVYDVGGATDIAGLRDVLRYASGALSDSTGHTLADRLGTTPTVVGLYAFSHPGIAAMNVMSLHGGALPDIDFVVGRESPTLEVFSSVELGYYDTDGTAVQNPLYRYPEAYATDAITIDYSSVRWDVDIARPYFDLDGSATPTVADFALGTRVPTMNGRRFYSRALTHALAATLTAASWPADLATPELADAVWPFRSVTTGTYAAIAAVRPDLHVMLVFAQREHVQPASDKPSIHHAYDGLRAAGLWTRLNADRAYADAARGMPWPSFPDNDANLVTTESTWLTALALAYGDVPGAVSLAPLAALAEMCDRARESRWEVDLDAVIPTL